jgi:hypothetical protein
MTDVTTIKPDESALDPIVEDETQKGYRVKPVPAALLAQLREAGVEPFTHVRMTGLNPARRRKITEVVQRAFFRDLKDGELLSNDQVLKLVTERGEWSPATEARMKELNERTTSKMATLYHEGVAKSREWLATLTTHIERVLDAVAAAEKPDADKQEYVRRFSRWHQYRPDKQPLYVERYKEELPTGVYYPDSDLNWLMDQAPTLDAADAVDDINELNDKIGSYLVLVQEREEYEGLRLKRLRMFANTVESRRDNAEEMAKAYFTTERCGADERASGPLAPTFDGLYDFPDDVITWLVEEQFFFHNRIPDEVREYVGTFGFLTAVTEGATEPPVASPTPTDTSAGSSEVSDASPAAATDSTATPPSTATPSSTSA